MRICVLGVGVTGQAVAHHAYLAGDEVVVYAGQDTDTNRQRGAELEKCDIDVIYSSDVQGSFDLCIPSPGISENSDFYLAAKSCAKETISEPEYAWRLSPENWIAITGTNGKTTTAALTSHILRFCGRGVALCGNTQDMTVLEAVSTRKPDDVIVAELSSFQLASTARFAPDVAILLNITPDHLTWHGSFESYCKAKCNIFAHMKQGSCAVIGKDALELINETTLKEEDALKKSGVELFAVRDAAKQDGVLEGVPEQEGVSEQGRAVEGAPQESDTSYAFIDEAGILSIKENGNIIELCKQKDMQLQGAHNMQNALCAAIACYKMGCEPNQIAKALQNFSALPHRIEFCGSTNNVSFYDDSKATNVDATIKALGAFPNQKIILLAGGRDKNSSLDSLVKAAKDSCFAVVCYGEAKMRFADAFLRSGVRHEKRDNLAVAFECACNLASEFCVDANSNSNKECVILLSPACASFDEFSGFEQRGDSFKSMASEFISNAKNQ